MLNFCIQTQKNNIEYVTYGIQRDTYLNKLIDHHGNGMIKIVTGLR